MHRSVTPRACLAFDSSIDIELYYDSAEGNRLQSLQPASDSCPDGNTHNAEKTRVQTQAENCTIFPDVSIGVGTRLGNYLLIRSNTRIGENCMIGSYVDVEGDVVIGNNVSLQSGCYITRGVIIEDDVFCGPRVITMNDKLICHRRPSLVFVRDAPRILRAARVGGGSVLMPGVTVGVNAFVGAGSVVTKDVPEEAIVAGNPARVVGRVRIEELL
jgi:acetyltransferase-like isoleucine patch superfamily enzyme